MSNLYASLRDRRRPGKVPKCQAQAGAPCPSGCTKEQCQLYAQDPCGDLEGFVQGLGGVGMLIVSVPA